jgi:PTS system nitrogen regulatory IIA component
MKIEDLIVLERVSCDNNSTSKKKVLEVLSQLLATDLDDISADEIFDSLVNRERLGSTGLGQGVALPHARLAGREKAIGAFVKLGTPVDFDALDNQPTDLLFSLLVPDHFTDEHLDILAELARVFSNQDFCQALRESESEEKIYQLLSNQTATSAA